MVIVLGAVGFAALEVWAVGTCAAARPEAYRLVAFGTMFRCCRLSKHLHPFCQTLICQILKRRNNLLMNLFTGFSVFISDWFAALNLQTLLDEKSQV